MVHSRAFRIAARLALALGLVLSVATPVAASSISATVATSSPFVVTVGKPVAFPITVKNTGKNTLNSIVVTGLAAPGFTYLSSTPPVVSPSTDGCSQTQPVCTFRQLASGKSLPPIVFYYRVPTTVAPSTRSRSRSRCPRAARTIRTGPRTTSTRSSPTTIITDVRAARRRLRRRPFAAGHAAHSARAASTARRRAAGQRATTRSFPLGTSNPHGTAVTIPVNAEVTASDVAPAADCPAAVTTCFGYGSRLSIANGASISGGILVTMRWDETDLPNGMTPDKLKVIHLFDPARRSTARPTR